MFAAAKAKLDRADKHIVELSQEFDRISKANTHLLQASKSSGLYFLKAAPPPMPAELTALLGDAVNNLRTSLDMMAYELAKPGAKSKFPFANKKETFSKAMKESGLASPAVRDYIEHAVMPYKGGDNDVWALHDTDIINKHHTLIPTDSGGGGRFDAVFPGGIVFTNCYAEGMGKSIIQSDVPFAFRDKGAGTTTMFFTEDSGFGKVPILPTLQALSKKLRRIVADIEGLVAQEN